MTRPVSLKYISSLMQKYSFKEKIWKHTGKGGWHFISLPKALSKKIRANHGLSEEGWGRLKATAKIGKSSWSTAIWFDSKKQTYLLPVKAEIRKKENIELEKQVLVNLLLTKEISTGFMI